MFSTFLKVSNNEDYPVWMSYPELERSMRNVIAQEQINNEEYWALYWRNKTLQDLASLAQKHVLAYFDEPCYWAAKTVQSKVGINDLTLMDCLQIARAVAAFKIERILSQYNGRSSLKTFAQLRICSGLLDHVREKQDVQKYTDWGLLRTVSKKALMLALQQQNIQQQEQSCYILAYYCFKESYVPVKGKSTGRLSEPNLEQWQALAERYNMLRSKHDIKKDISNSDIKSLLEICIKAIRENAKPPAMVSLDDPNILSDKLLYIPENEINESDLEVEFNSIREVLENAFADLPPESQKMLILADGLELHQRDIGKLFGIEPQYKVSREIKKLHKLILQQFAKWSQKNLNIKLSDQEIDDKSKEMYQWLSPYLKSSIFYFLDNVLIADTTDNTQILKLYYGEKKSLEIISQQLQILKDVLQQRLATINQNLQTLLKKEIENQLSISLASLESTDKQIYYLVDEWLKNAAYGKFEAQRGQ